MKEEINEKVVFLITIDALRQDHLKQYGYYRNTAPYLEKIVKKGTVFLNAFTNGPETPSSFSSIFSSILPFLDGGYSPLPLQKKIFPEILFENGIFTYAIHSNPNLGSFFNYDRGFNIFLDGERYKVNKNGAKKLGFKQQLSFYLKKILDYKDLVIKLIYHLRGFNKIKNWWRKKIPFLTDLLLPFTPIAYNANYMVAKVLSFLKRFNSSLFLWAHFMDIHSPYNPPTRNVLKFMKEDIRPIERKFLQEEIFRNSKRFEISLERINKLKVLYDAEINYMDEFLVKLFKFIESRYKQNCLLIITADHGEAFYEHGFFSHQGNIYDELLKVPLFLVEFGRNPDLKTVKECVQLIDIPSTILDYFGIKIPDYFQGRSLLPLINGKSLEREKYIISECYQKNGKIQRNNKDGFKLMSIRSNKWKYIFDEEKNMEYFFNLKSDPGENNNLINKNPIKLSEFRKIKEDHLKKVLKTGEKSKILKAIRTLKYK